MTNDLQCKHWLTYTKDQEQLFWELLFQEERREKKKKPCTLCGRGDKKTAEDTHIIGDDIVKMLSGMRRYKGI